MRRETLLVSDLDGTLLGNNAALGRFAEWHERCRTDVRLVYATGRFFDSVVELVKSTPLPEPLAVIGAAGTEVRMYVGGKRVGCWPYVSPRWNPGGIRSLLEECSELELQPLEFQTGLKVSYFANNLDPIFLSDWRLDLPDVEIIYSSNRYLDILPGGVNKGSAAAFLANRLHFLPEQVIVAGDDGNDVRMFQLGFRGIVVGNALPALKSITPLNAYHSRLPFADGVLDGIEYWLGE